MAPLQSELDKLVTKIHRSEYILAIVGAGLSRPSGLPTFREDPWFWDRPVEGTATAAAFAQEPHYVWSLYERLRLMSKSARPNAGHFTLAELARAKPSMLTISQNIDDLLEKAGHHDAQLANLHGSLFTVECSDTDCTFQERNTGQIESYLEVHSSFNDGSNPLPVLSQISKARLPTCPLCASATLRPGVCWFGERLPQQALSLVERWFRSVPQVDLVLVIGTERYPFLLEAQKKGAEVAYFNFFEDALDDTDDMWCVSGDASYTLPLTVGRALQQSD